MQELVRKRKILVFAPHPDDEAIACGGSIALHQRRGDEVTVAFLTHGDDSERAYEARNSCAILGNTSSRFLGFDDGFLRYCEQAIDRVVQTLEAERPAIVYTPHAQEADLDHQNTYLVVAEALKKFYRGPKPTVLCYEVWTPLSEPSYWKDISEVADIKREAILAHRSQVASIDFVSAALALNRYRGIMSRKGEYCEAFSILHFAGEL